MARAKTYEQIKAILDDVDFMDREIHLIRKCNNPNVFLLQVQYMEKDIHTGKMAKQKARKWYISTFSTETEIVETAFKACRVSMDHVLKEHFLYKKRRVYSPHFAINARIALCDNQSFDMRD